MTVAGYVFLVLLAVVGLVVIDEGRRDLRIGADGWPKLAIGTCTLSIAGILLVVLTVFVLE